MSESDAQWPPMVRIEGVDPYPWHGLCFRDPLTGLINWLQPNGGRPRVQRPALPQGIWDSHNRPAPQTSASLWNPGLPEPPFSQGLWDAGAESSSRRLVSSGSTMIWMNGEPCGARSQSAFDGGYELRAGRFGESIQFWPVVATYDIPLDAIRGSITTVRLPNGDDQDISEGFLVGQIDVNHDGTRRLFRMWRTYYSGEAQRTVSYDIGFFELVISADEEWNWSASINIVATTAECFGTYVYERSSNLFSGGWNYSTGNYDFTPIPSAALVVPSINYGVTTGTYTETLANENQVVGAYYDANNQVQLVRLTVRRTIFETGSATGRLTALIREDPPLYDQPSWSMTGEKTHKTKITYTMGAHSITAEHVFEFNGSADWDAVEVDGQPGYPSKEGTASGSHRYAVTDTPAEVLAQLDMVDDEIPSNWFVGMSPGANASRPAGVVYVPLWPGRRNILTLEGARTRPGSQGPANTVKGFYVRAGSAAGDPAWLLDVLTPAGVIPGIVADSSGDLIQSAFYNPMTGEGVRSAQHPDKIIQGYI